MTDDYTIQIRHEVEATKLARWKALRPDLSDFFLSELDFFGGEIEAVPEDHTRTIRLPDGTGVRIENDAGFPSRRVHPLKLQMDKVRIIPVYRENAVFSSLNSVTDGLYGPEWTVVREDDIDLDSITEENKRAYKELFHSNEEA